MLISLFEVFCIFFHHKKMHSDEMEKLLQKVT